MVWPWRRSFPPSPVLRMTSRAGPVVLAGSPEAEWVVAPLSVARPAGGPAAGRDMRRPGATPEQAAETAPLAPTLRAASPGCAATAFATPAPNHQPPAGCSGFTFREECDGDDVAGQTCTAQGYGSGALACSNACLVDTTGCHTCATDSPLVAGCAAVPSHAYDSFSIAASDTQTAMVWIDEPQPMARRRSGWSFFRRTWTSSSTGISPTW